MSGDSLINGRFCDLHNRLGLKDLGMWIGRGGIRRGDHMGCLAEVVDR